MCLALSVFVGTHLNKKKVLWRRKKSHLLFQTKEKKPQAGSSFARFRRCLDRTTRTTEVVGRRILHIGLDSTCKLPFYVLYYLPCRASSHFFWEKDTCLEELRWVTVRVSSWLPTKGATQSAWYRILSRHPQIWYEENRHKMVCPKNLLFCVCVSLVRFSDPLPMGSGSGDQCP